MENNPEIKLEQIHGDNLKAVEAGTEMAKRLEGIKEGKAVKIGPDLFQVDSFNKESGELSVRQINTVEGLFDGQKKMNVFDLMGGRENPNLDALPESLSDNELKEELKGYNEKTNEELQEAQKALAALKTEMEFLDEHVDTFEPEEFKTLKNTQEGHLILMQDKVEEKKNVLKAINEYVLTGESRSKTAIAS